jgi:hypothetical protein
MTARSVDWPWVLTNLCLYFLLAHFLLIIGAGLLFPDWSHIAGVTALMLAFLAVVLFFIVIWLDYRLRAGRAGPRSLLGVLVVGLVVIAAAEILEKTCGFNWWLTATATATLVVPIRWLYLRRANRRQQHFW